MKNIAIIFAGGVGSRMGSKIPKQFLEIYGKPIIIHTLEKFQYNDKIDDIYIGCKEEYIDLLKENVKKYNLTKVKNDYIIAGGSTGLETIYKLLKKVRSNNDEAVVLIHDGVRPNINDCLINKNVDCVLKYGNAITCTSMFETPIISDNGYDIDKCLDRRKIYIAKAPQSFKLTEILDAYESIKKENEDFIVEGIVDSCSVALSKGIKLKMVEGNRDNIKVTTSSDYIDILGRMIVSDYSNFFDMELMKR
jgi:2-C-methyl-D-erythritol 4-phosphate cytidylyltransferase